MAERIKLVELPQIGQIALQNPDDEPMLVDTPVIAPTPFKVVTAKSFSQTIMDISNANFWNSTRLKKANNAVNKVNKTSGYTPISESDFIVPPTVLVPASFDELAAASDFVDGFLKSNSLLSEIINANSSNLADANTKISRLLEEPLVAQEKLTIALWLCVHYKKTEIALLLLKREEASFNHYAIRLKNLLVDDKRPIEAVRNIFVSEERKLNTEVAVCALDLVEPNVVLELLTNYSIELSDSLLSRLIEEENYKALKLIVAKMDPKFEKVRKPSKIYMPKYQTFEFSQLVRYCIEKHGNKLNVLNELFLWTLDLRYQSEIFQFWFKHGLEGLAAEKINFTKTNIPEKVIIEAFDFKAYAFLEKMFQKDIIHIGMLANVKSPGDFIIEALEDPKGVLLGLYLIHFLTSEFFNWRFFDKLLEHFTLASERAKYGIYYSTNPLMTTILSIDFFLYSRDDFPNRRHKITEIIQNLLNIALEIQGQIDDNARVKIYTDEDYIGRTVLDIISSNPCYRVLLNSKTHRILEDIWQGLEEGPLGDMSKHSRLAFIERNDMHSLQNRDQNHYLKKIFNFRPDERMTYKFQYFKTKKSISKIFLKEYVFSLLIAIYIISVNVSLTADFNTLDSEQRKGLLRGRGGTSGYHAYVGTTHYILILLIHVSLAFNMVTGILFSTVNKKGYDYDSWIILDFIVGMYLLVFVDGIFPTETSALYIFWYLKITVAIEIIVMVLRIMVYSQMFKKFAPLLSTLIGMFSRIYDFIIVFACYMCVVSLIFLFFFGDVNDDYHNYGNSIATLFSAFYGEFGFYDYPNRTQYVTERVFLIIHVCVSMILLVNFLIAQLNSIFAEYKAEGVTNQMFSKLNYSRKYITAFDRRYKFGYFLSTPPPLNLLNVAFIPFAVFNYDPKAVNVFWDCVNFFIDFCFRYAIFFGHEVAFCFILYIKQIHRILVALKYGWFWKTFDLIVWILFGAFFLFIFFIQDTYYFAKLAVAQKKVSQEVKEESHNSLNDFVNVCRSIKKAIENDTSMRAKLKEYIQKHVVEDEQAKLLQKREYFELLCKSLEISVSVHLLIKFLEEMHNNPKESVCESSLYKSCNVAFTFENNAFKVTVTEGSSKSDEILKTIKNMRQEKKGRHTMAMGSGQKLLAENTHLELGIARLGEGKTLHQQWLSKHFVYLSYINTFSKGTDNMFSFNFLSTVLPEVILNKSFEKYSLINAKIYSKLTEDK